MNIFSQFISSLISAWVKVEKIQIPEVIQQQVKHEVPLVYVLERRSLSDWAVLRKQAKAFNLPTPNTQVINGVTIKNNVLFLKQRGYWFNRNNNAISPTLSQLIAAEGDDVQIVPVSIYWGRKPGAERTWLQALFGESWAATGPIYRIFTILLNGRNTFVEISQPLSLDALKHSSETAELLPRKLHRLLRVHFQRVRTAVLGPDLSHRRLLINQITNTAHVKKATLSFAKSRKISKERAHKTANKYANEIAANVSYPTLRLLDIFLTWLWNKIYKGVNVNNIESVKAAASDHTIIYVPCHRSHIDYLLMSYTLYYHGLNIPHIAAGVNLNMPVVGSILRRAGAFFMRRSFRGDKLYAAVFNEYMDAMIKKGYPLEYYVEGGRSRTGRTLDAKAGMLNMTVKSYLKHNSTPIAFVPVYIGYEKIFEGSSYLNELRGKDKKKENIFDLIKIIKRLKNYGQVNVNFGELIKLDEVLNHHASDWRGTDVEAVGKPEWFNPVIDQLCNDIVIGINSATAINPVNLTALVLLSTDRQAMDKDEAKVQMQRLVDLQKQLPYSAEISFPKGDANDWLSYCESLNLISVNEQKLGDVYQMNSDWVTLSTYYRNNILHLFAVPSLIACMFNQGFSVSRESIVKRIATIYPFIQQELHIHWSNEQAIAQTNAWIDALLAADVIHLQDNVLHPAADNTREYETLRILAHAMMPTLERYYITLSLLQKFGSGICSAGDLEKLSHQMAERLSLLNGVNAPEFFDRSLFKKFIQALREQNILSSNDDSKLVFGEQINTLMSVADQVLRRSVRLTIKQSARKS